MNVNAAIPHIMLVAGEPSGDALGGELMAALKDMTGGRVRFSGVGGAQMTAEGIASIFPMTDISVMGPREIVPRLPSILNRIRQTVNHAVTEKPDILIVIDSPEFTHLVARRVARRAPSIPIVDYVLPSVWAWRRGRARAMKKYIRRVLALLPFEPAFLRTVGVDCVYVGHPAIDRVPEAGAGGRFRATHGIPPDAPLLLVLPGSRLNEVKHLIGIFGETVRRAAAATPDLRVVLPVVPHVRAHVEAAVANWPVDVAIVEEEIEKRAAFDAATAALAASGTVSLELGLARVPMVVAYRAEAVVGWFALRILKIPSVVLVNLILDRPSVREYLQFRCTPEALAEGLTPLLQDTPERARALADLDELRERIGVGGEPPSRRAARAVLEILEASPA
ncbi:lipid-A-disaccharide synthase [Parvibaculum sp.]|uniref:lipid-A-disaccharide synthase n=1 Tax=Parvibaculum sp. TaxID=2024848 RepID=UPI002625C2B4|nr:lipid-A-disaccharide synthase [Parvibaculum sp.]